MWSLFYKNTTQLDKTFNSVGTNTEDNNTDKKSTLYVVQSHTSDTTIGVFDNLDDAIKCGQKTTYYNCTVIKFTLNDECKFINDVVFTDV